MRLTTASRWLLLWAACLPALSANATTCVERDLGFGPGADWRHLPLSKLKRDTQYSVAAEDGRAVLVAQADRSASVFYALLGKSPAHADQLSWRWKTDALVPGADNRERTREDAPLRVMAFFDGDRSRLPEAEQKRLKRASALAGYSPPYATLMYIWSDKVPVGTVIPSVHTSRLKMIVAASGPAGLGEWHEMHQPLADDFRRAFGEAPGPLLGVAVMTDTDNTGSQATGRYADLHLQCAAR
jgi:Protein of unknown function (DUF3047)